MTEGRLSGLPRCATSMLKGVFIALAAVAATLAVQLGPDGGTRAMVAAELTPSQPTRRRVISSRTKR